MNLYELKKANIESCPQMSPQEYEETWDDIDKWFQHKEQYNYFMLLGWEQRYFTLFERAGSLAFDSFISNLRGCVEEIGVLKLVEEDSGGGLIFWINNEFYLLFPYDEGVVFFS